MKRKLATAVLLLAVLSLISSCGDVNYWFRYTFENETRYTIYVTLDTRYATDLSNKDKNDVPITYNTPFSVNSNKSREVHIRGNKSVDFSWTASSQSDNRYIYVSSNGNRAIFKER